LPQITPINANQRCFLETTKRVIGLSYKVANTLGRGFVEHVYRNALAYELRKEGMSAEIEKPIKVIYDGTVIADFRADILIDAWLLIEVKVASSIKNIHIAQSLNYLKATQLTLCLLISFSPTGVLIKRVVNNF
jgi:GxxExxY protein